MFHTEFYTEVFTGSDLLCREFERFPAEHYAGDPFFRSPPSPPDHALRILLRDNTGNVCGRSAVMVNPGISFSEKPTGLMGWYECIEEKDAGRALFDGIMEACRELNVDYLLGPINGDTWHSYRIALPSQVPPFFLEPYNKPWYAQQFEDAGFAPVSSYHSSYVLPEANLSERIEKEIAEFEREGITIRPIAMDRFQEEIRKIYAISVEAFQNNLFYTPISEEEMLAMYAPLQGIVDPEFVLLAEDQQGETAGFVFAVPNLFAPPNDSLVVKSAAVRPALYGKGLGSLLIELIHVRGTEQGYREMIHALMQDANISANVSKKNSRTIRRYHLYGREL